MRKEGVNRSSAHRAMPRAGLAGRTSSHRAAEKYTDEGKRTTKMKVASLTPALTVNGCGCFLPDLTRFTTLQCGETRRGESYHSERAELAVRERFNESSGYPPHTLRSGSSFLRKI